MGGTGDETLDAGRVAASRGRPSWWVLLAMSLALMALVAAAAAGTNSPVTLRRLSTGTETTLASPKSSSKPKVSGTPSSTPAFTAVTSTVPTAAVIPSRQVTTARTGGVTTTTTTTAPAKGATTTQPAHSQPIQGYLQPPAETSSVYAFTSNGPMEVSVTWDNNTQLTLFVSCPDFSQSVGGSSAMAVSLPAAEGSCRATVSEPAPGTTTVAYDITIG